MKTIESHKQIASQCFNRVWDFLDMSERSREEEEQMVHLAHTSFWHWTQVEDHTPTNLSIGYWQLSRVYAVIGNGEQSLFYADRCKDISEDASIAPFYLAYAYEAIARAYMTLNQKEDAIESYNKSLKLAEGIVIEDSREMLLKDLQIIKDVLAF
ncbi:tetratricopeptide repeat protein [Bacillus sp. CGMCC 1.16607]|uniref:tetratricopeptide repeat protein n=1 Tax=Bacillus sp. CGMCC 1.16607 TaxID=3351842 RepID=UPI003642CB4D